MKTRTLTRPRLFRAVLLLALCAPAATLSMPAFHVVTDFGDSGGAGQLRTLMNAASPGDTIVIPAGTIVLTGANNDDVNASGDLDVTKDLTIVGAGAELTIIDGGGRDRIFEILPGHTAAISGLTMRNGFVDPDDSGLSFRSGGGLMNRGQVRLADVIVAENTSMGGGGIANFTPGALVLTGSTVRDNHSMGVTANGGGISNFSAMTIDSSTISGNRISPPGGSTQGAGIINVDTMTITNSTISGNFTPTGLGAGIYQTPSAGTLTLVNVTVAHNRTGHQGGGLMSVGGKVVMSNTILSDNEDGSGTPGRDCYGSIDSLGYNLVHRSDCSFAGVTTGNVIGHQAGLRPLDDNGGPTWTHALRNGSPAIDAGDSAQCTTQDQRGVPRITRCDIGAVEQR
jgi:hypothetical protein